MDLEHLSTHQIILVCLLVSFVSSIATGIVTVSLFDQAPPAITQTINRVVQTTVEKVTPTPAGGSVTTQTVVISEDKATVEAIEKVSKGIARIIGIYSDGQKRFVGFGVIANVYGTIVTRINYDSSVAYRAILNGGVDVPVTFVSVISTDDTNKLVLFKSDNGQGVNQRAFTPVTFADSTKFKLGQTLIALGGETDNSVTTGIVSSIISLPVAPSDATRQNNINRIRSDIYNPEYQENSVAINLLGEVVGLKIGTDQNTGYITSNIIKSFIPAN